MNQSASHTIVIFGASGDLTRRKLVPALYQLFSKGRLPATCRIVGFSRSEKTHESWRDELAASTQEFTAGEFDAQKWREFADSIYYHPGDVLVPEDVKSLGAALDELEGRGESTRVYYLSTAPRFYEPAVAHLGFCALADESRGPRRIVVEKPFGEDLESAQKLNKAIHEVFQERQVYRIDHYLGKETVQNIFMLRFANAIFEPLWNRNYIDHVQITAAERVVVGSRAGYYDTAGALRDMVQSHMLQLLTITAMEPPSQLDADLVRNEKVKVLAAVRRYSGEDVARNTIRAQYDGYREEEGVPADSAAATFAALKLYIDNWRWQGVPFYLRTGKAMDCRTTQIVIQFREPPHAMFERNFHGADETNRLVLHLQPAEGVQIHLQTKVPDAGMESRLTDLEFRFDRQFRGALPDAYERLLLDTLSGDASLFARSDEVELAWSIIDPIQAEWDRGRPALARYDRGLWGPDAVRDWIAADKRRWLDVCPVLK